FANSRRSQSRAAIADRTARLQHRADVRHRNAPARNTPPDAVSKRRWMRGADAALGQRGTRLKQAGTFVLGTHVGATSQVTLPHGPNVPPPNKGRRPGLHLWPTSDPAR